MKSPLLQSVQTLFLAKRLLDLNWRHMNVTHCWRTWRPAKKKKKSVDWINFRLGRICIKEVAAARAGSCTASPLARETHKQPYATEVIYGGELTRTQRGGRTEY